MGCANNCSLHPFFVHKTKKSALIGRCQSKTAAIFICTHACDLSENPGKMGRIGIADHLSDVADPKARVCQQLFCCTDTAVIEEIIKILLCIPVEKFGEVPL